MTTLWGMPLTYTQSECVSCLGVEHARSALEGAGCVYCEQFPLRNSFPCLVVFEKKESAQAHAPQERVSRLLHSWGSQMQLGEDLETASALSQHSTSSSSARFRGPEARSASSSALGK